MSALVYLSTKGVDFDGGDFVFIDAKKEAGVESTAAVNRTVEPRMARVSSFTSGNENLHHVAKGKSLRNVTYTSQVILRMCHFVSKLKCHVMTHFI